MWGSRPASVSLQIEEAYQMGAVYVSLLSLALGRRPVEGTIAFGEVINAGHYTGAWRVNEVSDIQQSAVHTSVRMTDLFGPCPTGLYRGLPRFGDPSGGRRPQRPAD